ncbi:hypothetical protein HO133_002002 [Letharia lupina]|uniref:Uncharacterized protein n=1 Tax=Letharia lupina TaxID=560253 RepID=A0A8H6FAW9_9LECA|nr:uncharacterized protein HO133_002002 [Letharia lupina]KAF6221148.1 hypothetical protein HO133_002002 [Letharia lupina]
MPSIISPFTDQHKNIAFDRASRMRSLRHRTLSSTIALPLVLLVCFVFYTLKTPTKESSPFLFRLQPGHHLPISPLHSAAAPKARQISPAELMARPPPHSGPHMPKLLHQSWSTTILPSKFEQWSLSCRDMNPDFEWVLWTDEDNRRLVEKYAPEFLVKYDGLKSEIYRADAHNISSSSQSGSTSIQNPTHTPTSDAAPISTFPTTSYNAGPQTAFLARMGADNSKKHSIPNAWLASTPSHPFWLLPLNLVSKGTKPYGDWPEAVTGPDALFYLVNEYLREYRSDNDYGASLDEFLLKSELKEMYVRSLGEKNIRASAEVGMHQLVLLGKEMIFPYWWGEKELEGVCKAGEEGFDPETCKDVLDVQALGSWSITYWSHSWDQEGGHDEGHLSAMGSWSFRGARMLRRATNRKRGR